MTARTIVPELPRHPATKLQSDGPYPKYPLIVLGALALRHIEDDLATLVKRAQESGEKVATRMPGP